MGGMGGAGGPRTGAGWGCVDENERDHQRRVGKGGAQCVRVCVCVCDACVYTCVYACVMCACVCVLCACVCVCVCVRVLSIYNMLKRRLNITVFHTSYLLTYIGF